MPTDTPTTTDAAEPTLAEAFGELSEGIVAAEDGGEDPGSAEAATPSAPADTTAEPRADTTAPAAPATATPSSAPASADSGQPQATTEASDPLAGGVPLTFTVNGATRTFDGATMWPGQGAVISADALPKLQDRLQQADRLVETNRELYRQTQSFERLGGLKAFETLQAERAVLDAAGSVLLKAMANEDTLIALATDEVARRQLLREAEFAARDAGYKARETFQQTLRNYAASEQATTQSQTAIGNAVAQLAQGFSGLTAEDVAAVRNHALRVRTAIVRPATADEAVTAGVRPGEPIIDLPTLHTFLADRHALRQQAATAARTNAAADAENKARMGAANATRTTGPSAPRPGAGKRVPAAAKGINAMTSTELTRAMKTGQIFDLVGADDQ